MKKSAYIRKLAFFGSVLRDDFREDNDIDVLVEFECLGWDLFVIRECSPNFSRR